MEPIAARSCGSPEHANAAHERLVHFVASPAWSDAPIREYAVHYAVKAMQDQGPIRTWIVDDTGFLKQGKHSPGVQRQYTGSAGKTANCQIGVSLVLANDHVHVPADFRLYIPESWAQDRERCRRAHIPDSVDYEPKWALALSMIEAALESGLPKGVVLADCDYGNKAAFRDILAMRGLQYAVEIQRTTQVRIVHEDGARAERIAASDVGASLRSRLRTVTWREGTKAPLRSRFARVRVVVERENGTEREPEWMLVEWPESEPAPTKYVLSTMPRAVNLRDMVRTFKSRWRIERSYEDLKGELGLNHYEGRSFVGWHHHVTVVLTCFAFLVAEHVRSFPPSSGSAVEDITLCDAA